MSAAGSAGPWRMHGGGGLSAVAVDGGGLASLAADGIELVQHAASTFEPGLFQVWLRDRASGRCRPTLGAGSGALVRVRDAALVADGRADGLGWRVVLVLHPARPAWAVHVEVAVEDGPPREVDLVHTHDVALADPAALRANELYVSQYLDLSPLDGPTGAALAVRQNQPQDGRHPWCVLAADREVVAWATDALSVHGLVGRTGGPVGPGGDLPARRLQHEHTLAALQVAPATLAAGERLRVTFAGLLLPDHGVTSPDDVAHAVAALDLARETVAEVDDVANGNGPAGAPRPAPSGPYDRGRTARVRDLAPGELRARWPGAWRVVERDADGTVLSFFAGPAGEEHVVLRAKEVAVLRPHGTILRTGDRAAPDPAGLTVTAWMTGSPLSYLTRGHVTTGRVLTTVRGYLGLQRAYGLRVLVEAGGPARGWRLLDLPSAFATTLDGAHWVYALEPAGSDPGGVVELATRVPAADRRAELRVVVDGPPRRVLVALHLAGAADPLPVPAGAVAAETTRDGVVVRLAGARASGRQLTLTVGASAPVTVADDGPLFDDGASRDPGVVTLATAPVPELVLAVTVDDAAADAVPPGPAAHDGAPWWPAVTPFRVEGHPEAEPLDVSLRWLVRDALVHHLSPRGLEQYSGGAWGTRDVTQGPLELLLALDRLDDARALVCQVLAAQDPDGSWPQAFGFLPGDEGFRMGPPHGDVVHWPVLALGRYLLASGDGGVLEEEVPWHGHPPTTVLDHVLRALDRARAGLLPGTAMVAYGHGDWNDSLQPADPGMAAAMTSTWTVILHRQALRALATGLRAAGGPAALAAALDEEAVAVTADLRRYLLVDGELAGYAQLEWGGGPAEEPGPRVRRYLVHPRDEETGLRHGALPIIHALADDLLDPAESARHVALVREHLMGADGVRLFDRPPGYHGGETRHFRRAETATFVGREIGLMYVHAHLRWCEALARLGDAEALWHAVRQALPATVGVAPDAVPGARRRQATTYASSSDAAVGDRAEFAARYAEVRTGATGFEGGWRIYSSGPGVLVRVVSQCLLGVRRRGATVDLDPVLPPRLGELTAVVPLAGGLLRLRYRPGERGAGVADVRLGDRRLATDRPANPYRPAGAAVRLADLAEALAPGGPEVTVSLS